ncbi:secretion protein EspA [Chromobacterium violaceum]|uniref:Probable secreted protein EspA n=1 Tax=Chromobacterium violaceum (strain ATCC 12472 / DSM 30191 / JCM 1249 / CCUG 213 / NBRC 12614 / NCIMB 9131 / NCTC 9757 / MK) TaxID=243365 RepID=Q7NUW8_CHRVO|nr:secretion protein EspA [Chromobacterium violaceum]AAQ60249.1 probable secreted protein EspA [Chromobacterium violaceum ATCC 12472]SUX35777.1 Secretion system effector B [Chromobacterium violaceum]
MNTAVNQPPSGVNVPTTGTADSSDNNDYLRAARNYSLLGQAITTMEEVMLLFTELSNAKFAQMSKKMEVSRDAQEKANVMEAVLASLTDPNSKGQLPPDVIEYIRENGILVGNQTIDDFIRENGQFVGCVSEGRFEKMDEYIKRLANLIESCDRTGSDLHPFERMKAFSDFMDALGVKVDGKSVSDLINETLYIDENGYERVPVAVLEKMQNALEEAKMPVFNISSLTAVKSSLESFSGRASDFVQQSQLKMQQLIQNFNTAVTMANSLQSMNAESTKSIAQAIR